MKAYVWCVGVLASLWVAPVIQADPVPPVRDILYPQEVTVRTSLPPDVAPNQLRLLDAPVPGTLLCFGNGEWFQLTADGGAERLPEAGCRDATEFTLIERDLRQVRRLPVSWTNVIQVVRRSSTVWVITPTEAIAATGDNWNPLPATSETGEIRQAAYSPGNGLWIASAKGVFYRRGTNWMRVEIRDAAGRSWGMSDARGIAFDEHGGVWIATPAGIARREANQWTFLDGRDGVPHLDLRRAATGGDGSVWFGTGLGAIRFDGTNWAYRQGPRWVPGDDIRDLVVEPSGTAWFLTDNGVGALERRPMTLWSKAQFYERELNQYIRRTEFGFTSEVYLSRPGDRSEIESSDSDNDGLWTAMYGASQCYAFAATREPAFRERARQAFEALRFLQKVTQGGSHQPPRGFVARTIRPVDWPDPNVGRTEADQRIREKGDRLWKVLEPRWPKSADGRWYWKADTSSDELDGHYFFYARYFDLVADDAEKERVREVVRDLTDHLVNHGFCLVDHDGTPTRWGVFGPQYLNSDPNWWVERGLNSLSILSYLAVAEHITGDSKYASAARSLIEDHGYGANVMNPKTQSGPGSGNQSDDEMAFMCFYNLLKYSKENAWRSRWMYAFHAYAALELPERNPFFNLAYAALGRGQRYSNPWGDFSLDPWEGWLEDSITALREFSLDRVNWPHRNSHRADIIALPPQQSPDLYDPRSRGRGHRPDGKVLPVAERHFNHWNTDPWRLDYGGDGRELASGTVFLLPYYLGLHYGFIQRDP